MLARVRSSQEGKAQIEEWFTRPRKKEKKKKKKEPI